jgi:hypothetical protein
MKKLLSVLGIVFLSLQTFGQVNLSNGLVAYYPFNGNANDASGNGLNGTMLGASLTTDRNSITGQAMYFDGSGAYVKVNHSSLLQLSNGMSLSYWINPQINSGKVVMKGRDVNAGSLNAHYNGAGITYAYGNYPGYYNTSNPKPLNTWYLVIFTYDRINKTMNYYENAVLVGTSTNVPDCSVNNSDPLVFGRHCFDASCSSSFVFPYQGKLDEIRIYNRALTSDEVSALYGISTQTITGFNPPNSTTYGSTFSLNASVSSGLPITYSSNNSSIVGISGSVATATGIGVVTLTVTQLGNASVAGTSLTSVLTVTKANLTVRVNNAYRLYSYNNPTFTSSVSGLAFNENVISSYYTSATSASGVGFYTIYPIITANGPLKYNITTLTGTLEIGLPTITVTSPPVTITSVITVTSPPVTVTSINTITVTSPPVTVTGNCPMVTVQGVSLLTEVQSIYPNASIYIYPNPTSGNLTISATNVTVSWIEVYNSAGILVQTQAGTSINISAQPAGIYSIWLKDSQNRYLAGQKISKQ